VTLTVCISALEAWFYVGVAKLATERLKLDILGFGGLLTTLGVGLLAGALLAHRCPKVAPIVQQKWLACSMAVIAGASLGLSVASSFTWASVAMAITGLGTAMCLTASDTLFQQAVPDRLRGRVFTARGLLANVAFAGFVATAGSVSPHIGVTSWFLTAAGIAATIAASVWMEVNDLNLFYLTLRWFLKPVAWWYCRVRRTGFERIPATGPALVAPNHPSRMDGALLIAYSPRRLYFLASETNWNLKWLGWVCTKLGCVPVSKTNGNSNAVHTALRLLAQGKAVCIFPGGQISREVGALRPGVAILAAMTGAPIVPVGIRGSYEAMPPKEKLRRHPVALTVGPVMRTSKVKLERVPEEIIERVNEEISQALKALAGQQAWRSEDEVITETQHAEAATCPYAMAC